MPPRRLQVPPRPLQVPLQSVPDPRFCSPLRHFKYFFKDCCFHSLNALGLLFEGSLTSTWPLLGRSWASFGTSWGPYWSSQAPLGLNLEPLGRLLGPTWAQLGPSWVPFGSNLGSPWASETQFLRSWVPPVHSKAFQERSRATKN